MVIEREALGSRDITLSVGNTSPDSCGSLSASSSSESLCLVREAGPSEYLEDLPAGTGVPKPLTGKTPWLESELEFERGQEGDWRTGDGEGEPKLDPGFRTWLLEEVIERLDIQDAWRTRDSST